MDGNQEAIKFTSSYAHRYCYNMNGVSMEGYIVVIALLEPTLRDSSLKDGLRFLEHLTENMLSISTDKTAKKS